MFALFLSLIALNSFNSPTPSWPAPKYIKTWPTDSPMWKKISYSSTPDSNDNKNRKTDIIIISVSLTLICILVLCAVVLYAIKRRKMLILDRGVYRSINATSLIDSGSNDSVANYS